MLGYLLVEDSGWVRVNLLGVWARGVGSRATKALLAQESNRCRYKIR